MGKKLRLVLDVIGTALDIKDISALIKTALGAISGASALAGAVKWINQNVPTLSLILFGVGAFFVLLVFMPNLVGFIRRVFKRPKVEKGKLPANLNIESTQIDATQQDQDALDHVVIERRPSIDLAIHRGRAGWPVVYPLRFRNTRPHPVDIIGYNIYPQSWGPLYKTKRSKQGLRNQ